MTYTEILTDVQANSGRSDSGAAVNIKLAISRALRLIESEGNWYWMEDVWGATAPTAGTTDRLTLPANFKTLRGPVQWFEQGDTPVDTGRHPIFPISEGEANSIYATDNSGDPERYRIWKGQLYLYPPARVTDRTIRMPYWKWSDPIDWAGSPGGNNEISTHWPDLWISRATAEYLKSLRDFKGMAMWLGEPRAPLPSSYAYELVKLRRDNSKRKLPRSLGARSDSRPDNVKAGHSFFPFWNR